MKEVSNVGKFYDIYEVDDRLVFRVYGKNQQVVTSFNVYSKCKNLGFKMIWLVAGALSPLYCLVVFFEALVISIFLFLMVVAIIAGTNVYTVMALGLAFSFVYTAGIGRLIRAVDPKNHSKDRRKKRVVIEDDF